ncbi:transglutaminase domain-containing protein [Kribbella sandramycini]|uniref:Transglutaminase domain-containing protein n=1 Tax=Kribbella sandramycini TaxID=60450 RepID=A0A7Y4P156_9ACTN|nr:transglutaminase-like domain-containing protein [Kribbella sandramycini]MBB6570751.1 hypothetical protein [Kribbella sandramycini]NOL43892.1 transglutaminase domain-containing protein [Kribbella sandramycini]
MDYMRQTPYSDPGAHAHLFDALPDDIPAIGAVVRNLLIHYRGGGIEFTGDRLAEIDHRWVSAILGTDQRRNSSPLAVPRQPVDRVVGCCRDYTLLFVSALRHKGIPARSRIGFAAYFGPGFHYDHVVAEYWNGDRWVLTDPQLDPAADHGFDALDMPVGPFLSAAEVWLDTRAGRRDPDTFGVEPGSPYGGAWFINNYVYLQLAHLYGDETLLWDVWPAHTAPGVPSTPDRTDEVANLLLAFEQPQAAEALAAGYPEWGPAGKVYLMSPSGAPERWDTIPSEVAGLH